MKHGVSFDEAATIFADPHLLTMRNEEHSETEDRWLSLGVSERSRELVVVHTWPDVAPDGDEVVRIISARRASKPERELYWKRRHEEEL